MTRAAAELERLVAIMAKLRSPEGCPWDRAQDHASLRPYLIEEAYEVLEQLDHLAAGEGSMGALAEELGDLLLQVVFHAQLAREQGAFELADAIKAICDKLEYRHPHVFGDAEAANAEAVALKWAELKAAERRRKTGKNGSALDGVPLEAPALLRAERMTEKASRVHFDFRSLEEVRGKVSEELAELDEAIAAGERAQIEHEMGDSLFALANLSRWLGCHPEDALRGTLGRFGARFRFIEARLEERGIAPGDAGLELLDALWDEAKLAERSR